jgi:hypothetical protein
MSVHKHNPQTFIDATMKSPSQTQSTSNDTSIYPLTVSNSIREALSGNTLESPVFPPITVMTETTPQSETVERRRRLRMILDSAIAIVDGGDDLDPMESSTTKQQQLLQ